MPIIVSAQPIPWSEVAVEGAPHFGQAFAAELISVPHSLHFFKDIHPP